MEKTALIQEFRTRLGEDNAKVISDKTFDGIADTVLPLFADDSKITEETWKLPIAMLTQYAGQKRHDEAEFAKKYQTEYATQHEQDVAKRIKDAADKAVEEYKKAHPDKPGGEGGDGGKGGEGGKDDLQTMVSNAVAEAMKGLTGDESELSKALKSINAFTASQAAREKTDNKNRVKTELISYLTGLEKEARKGGDIPAEIQALIEDAATYLDYGEDPKTDALKPSIKAFYEKEYKRRYPNGGQPFGGSSTGGGGGETNTFVKEKIEQLKKEAKESADYATEQEKTFC